MEYESPVGRLFIGEKNGALTCLLYTSVRVAGYSAYFVELGKPLQKDLIGRTELHF